MDKRFSRMIESGTKLTFVAMLLFVAATCWKGHWGLAAAQLLLVVLLFLYYRRRSKRRSAEIRKYVENLAFSVDAYDEEVVDAEKNDVRTVLRLHPALAPYKVAVLPLSKKLGEKGREIQAMLSKYFMVDYDDAGSIGKRYRRQDEIGTPYCVTVDFETVGDDKTPADNAVTIRDRDTMEQVRVPIAELKNWLEEKLAY